MAVDAELGDGRTYGVSFDIGPARPAGHQAQSPRTEPDRVESRLSDAEHRLSVLEGGLATLTDALYGKGNHQ